MGLGLREHGEKTARENIARIAAAARAAGTTVTIDMEDHTRVDQTLQILGQLRPEFPDLGCVIQSYLRRSPEDCRALATAGSRVRLCKGAYSAAAGVAFTARADVDRCYARCLRVLLGGPGYPMLATHDPRLIRIAGVRAAAARRSAGSFEYQMLYGIRPAEQLRLARPGAQVRVYLPYGQDWYGYLVRRLAERPANLAFFLRSLAIAPLSPARPGPGRLAERDRSPWGREDGRGAHVRAAAGRRGGPGRGHRRGAPRASGPSSCATRTASRCSAPPTPRSARRRS